MQLKMDNNKILIFVLDDGINNSVFAGQVLQPLLKKIEQNIYQKIYLVSFEKHVYCNDSSLEFPRDERLIIIQFKRLPFLGKISLYPSIYQLKKFLKNFNNYDLIARGPSAGWVAIKSIESNKCNFLTIQARGLLAAEYECTHLKTKNLLKNIWHNFRKKALFKVEKETFTQKKITNFCIESVTFALKEYLIEHFGANPKKITIAKDDFPETIPHEKRNEFRSEIRKKLNVAENTHIYCYSGSVKAWQYPELIIDFFKEKLTENNNIFLLILTQDVHEFSNFLNKENLDSKYYKIINVQHSEIYKYLSACDTGLIFRKKDIVSWVSRPVKAMEYKSVGLNIVHNNTVKWLIDL